MLFEHNGNKIAFLGCNAKGGGYATASETTRARDCDFDWMPGEISVCAQEGYLPIVTFQHHEILHLPGPTGSGARFPEHGRGRGGDRQRQPGAPAAQTFEFDGDAADPLRPGQPVLRPVPILAPSPITDRAFLDRHVFYDGRYLGVELLTIQFVDLARSRPMTPEEQLDLLRTVFKAQWVVNIT